MDFYRHLPGRSSHIENRTYDRFAKQGQFLFRFIHQYYAEIRKEMQSFIQQSRTEPQILELLDPNTAMPSQVSPQKFIPIFLLWERVQQSNSGEHVPNYWRPPRPLSKLPKLVQ